MVFGHYKITASVKVVHYVKILCCVLGCFTTEHVYTLSTRVKNKNIMFMLQTPLCSSYHGFNTFICTFDSEDQCLYFSYQGYQGSFQLFK